MAALSWPVIAGWGSTLLLGIALVLKTVWTRKKTADETELYEKWRYGHWINLRPDPSRPRSLRTRKPLPGYCKTCGRALDIKRESGSLH